MLSSVARWSKEGEQQIHGTVIDRSIGDGGIQSDEYGRHPINALQSSVRNRNAGAQAGRAQSLALEQGLQNAIFRQSKGLAGGFSHRMQGLTL